MSANHYSYPIHLPWYGLLLALAICTVLFVPIGIVMAITNQQSSLYLICQLICGIVFPGRPVANMVFVTYGYVSVLPISIDDPVPNAPTTDNINPRPEVLLRPKTRPLHENPTPSPLQSSDGRHHPLLAHPNRRVKLDAVPHPRNLHSRSDQWLHLPDRPGPLQRVSVLGVDRSAPRFRSRRYIPALNLGFLSRRYNTHRRVSRRSEAQA